MFVPSLKTEATSVMSATMRRCGDERLEMPKEESAKRRHQNGEGAEVRRCDRPYRKNMVVK